MDRNSLSEQAIKALAYIDQLKCGVIEGNPEAIESACRVLRCAVENGDRDILWAMLYAIGTVAEKDIETDEDGGQTDDG